MEQICKNGKLDFMTKFASPEMFFPFAQSVNRPFCPCKQKTTKIWHYERRKKAIHAIYGTEKQRIPGSSAHKPITHAQKDTHVSAFHR